MCGRGWRRSRSEESLPDAEFLRGLRERSAAVVCSRRSGCRPSPYPSGKRSDRDSPARGCSLTPALVPGDGAGARWRRVVAMAAAAGLAGAALWLAGDSLPSAQGGVTLGDVLRRTAASQSLQLEVRRKLRQQAEVWVRDGERVRWEDAPGQYAIARGSQLWRIDEAANTAQRAKSPWSSDTGVDLIALLEAGGNFQLERRRPAGSTRRRTAAASISARTVWRTSGSSTTEAGRFALIAYADLAGATAAGTRGVAASMRSAGPPLAELRLVARNVPVDESKFVVAESLTEDGRIGKVLDVQGLVAVQPPLARAVDARVRARCCSSRATGCARKRAARMRCGSRSRRRWS